MMVSSLVTEVPLQSVTSILTFTGPVWSPSNEMGISIMDVFSVTDNSGDAKPTVAFPLFISSSSLQAANDIGSKHKANNLRYFICSVLFN